MLVRGWLVRTRPRETSEKVRTAAEKPASRGVPPGRPRIRPTADTKRGRSSNQGAKIMCRNQSAGEETLVARQVRRVQIGPGPPCLQGGEETAGSGDTGGTQSTEK